MRHLLIAVILVLHGATAVCQQVASQQFEIVDPRGQITAVAEIRRGRLTVMDNDRQQIDYRREPRYDSQNGEFLGYFNFEQNRVLRFPRSGVGPMFAADLNEATPTYRQTIRTVRPRNSRPQSPASANLPAYEYGGFESFHPDYYPPIPTRPPIAAARSVLIDSKVVPNPPLTPATVELVNSGNRDIEVAIVGLAPGVRDERLRLAPAQRQAVSVQRDSGGTRINEYRAINIYGDTFTKQTTVAVPPQPWYEIVVHEWAMQSIAIDRTGKSPNPIEDINFQGRGIGRFTLPAGAALGNTTIDVLRAAQAANNAGAVAPLVNIAPANDPAADEPLNRALRDVLQQQQRASER